MLSSFGDVFENSSLENYNTYGIKTNTKYLIKIDSINSLVELIKYLNNNNMKYYILGKGSNVILPDNSFNGVIISLEKLNNVIINENKVEAECGVVLSKLVNLTIENNLKGLEHLALIPGTLGGALFGNAGVKDHEIYDYLESITIIRNGKLVTLNRKDINITYRHTEFKDNHDIIVKVIFKLEVGKKEELLNIVKENRQKRLSTQPLEYKNAGSVFKNPDGYAAGKLIEDAGLKGFSVGDAEVSPKHANFIINKGNATSKDIKELIDIIVNKVYDKFKIKLELEQIIVEWN